MKLFKVILSKKIISTALYSLTWIYVILNLKHIPLPLVGLLCLLSMFTALEATDISNKQTAWINFKRTINWKIFTIAISVFILLLMLFYWIIWNL